MGIKGFIKKIFHFNFGGSLLNKIHYVAKAVMLIMLVMEVALMFFPGFGWAINVFSSPIFFLAFAVWAITLFFK